MPRLWLVCVTLLVPSAVLAAPVPKAAPLIPHAALKVGSRVDRLTFSGDNKFLAATTGFDGKVTTWDLTTGKLADVCLDAKTRLANGPQAFTPNGNALAFVHVDVRNGGDCRLDLWDVSEKKVTVSISCVNGVNEVAFSPDGKTLAVALSKAGGAVQLFETATGKELMAIEKTDMVLNLVFHPDGKTLCGAGIGGIRCWDVATGQEVATRPAPKSLYTGLAISPDGKTLTSSCGDLLMFDLSTGQENSLKLRKQVPMEKGVRFELGKPGTFSPDGTLLAVGVGKAVRLCDVATGKVKAALKNRHDKAVRSVAFRADGKVLATGSDDGTVQLWDVELELKNPAGGK